MLRNWRRWDSQRGENPGEIRLVNLATRSFALEVSRRWYRILQVGREPFTPCYPFWLSCFGSSGRYPSPSCVISFLCIASSTRFYLCCSRMSCLIASALSSASSTGLYYVCILLVTGYSLHSIVVQTQSCTFPCVTYDSKSTASSISPTISLPAQIPFHVRGHVINEFDVLL